MHDSFVKSSKKYFRDVSILLRSFFLSKLAPERMSLCFDPTLDGDTPPASSASLAVSPRPNTNQDAAQGAIGEGAGDTTVSATEELRCVVAVLRHGDRQPKQKMKMKVHHPSFLRFFNSHAAEPRQEIKLKEKKDLADLLKLITQLLLDYSTQGE
jgi:hypothetical protein